MYKRFKIGIILILTIVLLTLCSCTNDNNIDYIESNNGNNILKPEKPDEDDNDVLPEIPDTEKPIPPIEPEKPPIDPTDPEIPTPENVITGIYSAKFIGKGNKEYAIKMQVKKSFVNLTLNDIFVAMYSITTCLNSLVISFDGSNIEIKINGNGKLVYSSSYSEFAKLFNLETTGIGNISFEFTKVS